MQFYKVFCVLLICVCSGNAVMDPVLPAVLPEMSTMSFKSITNLTTTPSTTTLEPTTPSTTTLEPTTPSTTTPSTTTLEPTTPTTTPSATTLKPNPPHPYGMNWVVVDEATNITCIVVKVSATVNIPYSTIDGNVENATIAVPGNSTANGTCNLGMVDEQNTQKISLQWTSGQSVIPNVLTFVFHKNVSSGNDSSVEEWVFISEITLQVYLDSINFPNATRESVYAEHLNSNLHSVHVNNSYRCNSQESIEMDVPKLDIPATIHMVHLQMEAFRTSANDKFSFASDCPADKVVTSDIVPIAVGCALAALVVIVLVAYLIGRRRARQRGYQSV